MKFSGGRWAGLGSESEVVNAPVTAKQGATVVAVATAREKERVPRGARQGLGGVRLRGPAQKAASRPSADLESLDARLD